MSPSFDHMDYRELQTTCKEYGLKAIGTKQELRQRLIKCEAKQIACDTPVSVKRAATPSRPSQNCFKKTIATLQLLFNGFQKIIALHQLLVQSYEFFYFWYTYFDDVRTR
jgi:hypothetical protein